MSRTGEVISSSMVPERFSSANSRMVIMGIRNSPMTLTFISSGRITHSFMSIGMPRPIICDSMPRLHEDGRRHVEEVAEDEGEHRHQQVGDRGGEVTLQFLAINGPDVSHCAPPAAAVLLGRRQLQEDLLQAERHRPQFVQVPAALHHRARQARCGWSAPAGSPPRRRRACRRSPWGPRGSRPAPAPGAAGPGRHRGCASRPSTSTATLSEPRSRRVRFSTESVATSLPLLMMITCSQVCSTSGRMCVLRMMVWSPASVLDELARLDDLLGIEARGGLVEDQHIGVVDDRLGQADALPVALGELAQQLVAHVADGAALQDLIHAPAEVGLRDALEPRHEGQVLDRLPSPGTAAGFRAGSRCASLLPWAAPGRRNRPPAADPRVGGRKQVRTRMVVVFPAPFGPRKPTIWPFSTSKEMLSTATVRPYRLVRPSTLII